MLFKLLSAPVMGPLKFVEWVGSSVEGALQVQLNDTEAIKTELTALEKKLESGALSEDEFEELELVLVRRLQAAAKRLAAGERG